MRPIAHASRVARPRPFVHRAPLTLAALALLVAACQSSDAASERAAEARADSGGGTVAAVEVREWTVPWERTGPRDPYVDGEGRVWFVGQRGNYIAYLEPETGQFKRYEIDAGTHPHNLVVAKDGAVWFTGNRNGRLVKLDPASGALSTYRMPDSAVRDPHTMILDDAGNAWFTAQQADVVGRRDAKTGDIRLWRTGADSRPYGITLDPRGRVWLDLFGTNKLAMIDPATMRLREYPLPHERARPRRIEATPDGAIWYADYTRGYLGRLDPETGQVEEFAMPGGEISRPYAMAVDHRGRVWLAESGVRPNRLVAFDPKTRTFTDSASVQGGGENNTIRHMVFHAPTKSIWFGTDRNTIGRARLN